MLKRLFLLLIPVALPADSLDDAARALAAKIATHLDAGETVRVTARNLTSLPAAEVTKAQSTLEGALRRRVRNPMPVEVVVTISESVKGYLLVAQIRKAGPDSVELVDFKLDSPGAAPALIPIERRLLWEQPAPILDLVVIGDRMFVLEPDRLVRYAKLDDQWRLAESAALSAPPTRDPRGRIEIALDQNQNSAGVFLQGGACRGTAQPLMLTCDPVIADFTLDGAPVHFTPGRNTLEGQRTAGPPDAGDAIAACGGKVLASGGAGPDVSDTVTLFEGSSPVSERVELPGPVTALWPGPGTALTVVRDLKTNAYAAYALTPACGR